VIRSSALAGVFKEHGWEPCLWGEGDANALPRDVRESFVRFDATGDLPADLLCIDEMYTSQSDLEKLISKWRARNPLGTVVGMDDMQNRSMAGFDVVVNTEIGLSEATYEAGKALLGERYALLRRGFSSPVRLERLPLVREEQIPVLVMMGGTDPYGYTSRVLAVLAGLGADRFVPVVVGRESLELALALKPFEEAACLSQLGASEIAAWMRFCRLGVIACGSSLYEAAAMELPFVGLSIVDNQTATARQVETLWGRAIHFCEDGRFDPKVLSRLIEDSLSSDTTAYSSVDTKGARRVFEVLASLVWK